VLKHKHRRRGSGACGGHHGNLGRLGLGARTAVARPGEESDAGGGGGGGTRRSRGSGAGFSRSWWWGGWN